MKSLFFTSGIVLLMASCAQKNTKEQAENYRLHGDTVILADHAKINNVLRLDTVTETPYRLKLTSAGRVKAIPNFYADIAPPFSGRVTKVYMKLGMKVNPGTPLFEMVSPDFIDTQKNFFAAKSDLKKAELGLKRQSDLKKNGVGSSKDLEEAENTYEVALKEYENSRASLKIYNTNPEKLVLGQPLVICSPIAGEVITNEVVSGHYLKSDDAPHATIAQLNKVWVVGQVKEKDIRFIHEGDDTEIEVVSYPGRKITGKVYHVEELVEEETRSVRVLIVCDNKDFALKPGMYATVNFTDAPQNVAVISAKSVLQKGDKSFVFVQAGPARFVRRNVVTGGVENGRMVVNSGLVPGERVVSDGSFYLLEAK